ncbi:MAG: hypothetical protein LBI06_01965 [Treponema sp.]|jgi:hypothetical protein|nr:hypothetical protein [Treponema sp.]
MKTIKKAVLLLPFLICISCVGTPKEAPEFFVIESNRYKPGQGAGDYIVVANPPKGRSALRRAVEAYNRKTMLPEELKTFGSWHRIFFRETKYMTRDFRRGEPYPQWIEGTWWAFFNAPFGEHQYYYPHLKDILIETTFDGNNGSWTYFYSFKRESSQMIRINEIEDFFDQEKWEEMYNFN